MWWQRNRWKVLLPIFFLALLTVAFWYGGKAPGLQGWQVDVVPSTTANASPSAVVEVTISPTSSMEPSGQTITPKLEPSQVTSETSIPTPGPATVSALTTFEGSESPSDPLNCTISIRCDTILNHMDALDEEKRALVPEDGIILPPTVVTFTQGESAFDTLRRICQEYEIHMEFSATPIYNSVYIEGIQNLYEFDCGELSGWMYCVNGQNPTISASNYFLESGDVIEWCYTCDQGADIANASAVGG